MKPIKCSIIVPIFNAEYTIERCIESLLEQESRGKYEIIAVDNGSTDKTAGILRRYEKRITILKEKQKGASSARNKGIKYAKGNVLIFIDADCYASSDWLGSILLPFKNQKIKAVGGAINAWEKKNLIQRYCEKFWHMQEYYLKSEVPFFATANTAINRKHLSSEMFNERLRTCEDIDFFYRNNIKKDEMYYEKKAKVYHYYNPSIINFIAKSYFYGKWVRILKGEINKNLFIKKMPIRKLYQTYGFKFFLIKLIEATSFRIGFLLSF